MKNKDIISAAEKYIETAEKDTYVIRKAFIDGARWMNEQEGNDLSLGYVSGRFLKDLTIRMKNWGNLLKNKPIPKDEEIAVNAYIKECGQIIKHINDR